MGVIKCIFQVPLDEWLTNYTLCISLEFYFVIQLIVTIQFSKMIKGALAESVPLLQCT